MKTQQVSGHKFRLESISIFVMGIHCVYQPLCRHAERLIYSMIWLLVGVSVASAGSFQVSPIRATLSPSKPISAMTVHNSSNESLVVQMEVLTWTQQQGKDVYVATQDIIATPPIFTVPAGGSQVVRVGLRRAPDAQREQTYRLFLQEAPPPPKPGFQGLQVALRIGVPIFVAPATAQPPALAWRVYRTRSGQLEVGLNNNGNTHVQVANVSLADAKDGKLGVQQLAAYVLAGQSSNWQIKSVTVPASVSSVHLIAQTDGGVVDAGVLNVEAK
jgi:fimbrial chaperone protein